MNPGQDHRKTNQFHFRNPDVVLSNFYKKIIKADNGCWNWTGYKNEQGYGSFCTVLYNETLAHRVSYNLHNKFKLPKSLCVLHKCDNPSCVNPDHLFIGDRDLNNKDRAKKGRTITPNMNLTHCKRGHHFDESNTIIRKNGTRLCRKCHNAETARRKRERKAGLR